MNSGNIKNRTVVYIESKVDQNMDVKFWPVVDGENPYAFTLEKKNMVGTNLMNIIDN